MHHFFFQCEASTTIAFANGFSVASKFYTERVLLEAIGAVKFVMLFFGMFKKASSRKPIKSMAVPVGRVSDTLPTGTAIKYEHFAMT